MDGVLKGRWTGGLHECVIPIPVRLIHLPTRGRRWRRHAPADLGQHGLDRRPHAHGAGLLHRGDSALHQRAHDAGDVGAVCVEMCIYVCVHVCKKAGSNIRRKVHRGALLLLPPIQCGAIAQGEEELSDKTRHDTTRHTPGVVALLHRRLRLLEPRLHLGLGRFFAALLCAYANERLA